jgi:hypothetical protein
MGWDAERDEAVVELIPQFILADSAFANTPYVVTTFDMNQVRSDPAVGRLNHRLSTLRYHVECAFGILKGRFRILQRPLDLAISDVKRAHVLFESLFALHNYALAHEDKIDEQEEHEMIAAFREAQHGHKEDEPQSDTAVEEQRVDERGGRGGALGVFSMRRDNAELSIDKTRDKLLRWVRVISIQRNDSH